jgi:mycobactin lysine-N-oxygenase
LFFELYLFVLSLSLIASLESLKSPPLYSVEVFIVLEKGISTRARLTLAVVGAGPKAMAIAAKAKVLHDLGLGTVRVVVIEKSGIAAHWDGTSGLTNGEQILGTSPHKDIGFPYRSVYGPAVAQHLLAYSWPAFLIDSGTYSDWIDQDQPKPRHKQWARYCKWVAEKAGVELIRDTVTLITPTNNGLTLSMSDYGALECDGVVLTGPGEPYRLPGAESNGTTIFNGSDYWQHLDAFQQLQQGKIAVIGSGETAGCVITSLLSLKDLSPHVSIDVIARRGTLFTRGEGFFENRMYSNPDLWHMMSIQEKQEFIRRTDRGVSSAETLRLINSSSGSIHLVIGNAVKVEPNRTKVHLFLDRQGISHQTEYDKVIVASGFDPVAPFHKLFPAGTWDQTAFHCPELDIDYHLRLPVGKERSYTPNIHAPMLAGLAQGPGFPNLSCLGVLSDRVLSCYVESSR